MVLFDRNLCDFKDEIKEEDGDRTYLFGEEEEDVSQFFSCYFNKIKVFQFVLLISDEVLTFNIIILAQQL